MMASGEVDIPRRDRDRGAQRDGDSYRPSKAARSRSPPPAPVPVRTEEEKQAAAKAEYEKLLTMRSGGTYIPPARLRALQAQITDKTSKEYQRMAWEALKKSINGLINKVNTANIKYIVPELFGENLVRGRGLFCRSIMKAQAASLPFTPIYAAMAAIVNTKLPQVGELLVKRIVMQFRKGFKRNDKAVCLSSTTFLAHLINQQVQYEMLAGQILLLLLHKPTDDSVEIAVGFCREVGQYLEEMQPSISMAVFDQFRNILHEADIDKRTQYMIEVLFQVRKDKFKDNPAVKEELDLVEEEDQITHRVELDGEVDVQDGLNIFNADPEEAVHKLMKINLPAGQESELPSMVVECCSQEKTYTKFFGLIGERFSKINRLWCDLFEQAFVKYYETIHRYENNKLRNIAMLFGHMFASDALGWHCLSVIHLNEDETTSSSRIFIKILFQNIAEETGMAKLRTRLSDETLRASLEGLFPKDSARNIRFSINYFTSIGMGALTEEMREFLQNMPKPALPAPPAADSDSDSVSSYSSYTGSSYSRSRSRSPRRVEGERGRSLSRTPSRRGRARSYSSSRSRSRSHSRSPPARGRQSSYSASPQRRRPGSVSRSRSPAPRGGRGRARSGSYSSQSRSRTPPARRARARSGSYASQSRSPSPAPRNKRARSRSGSYGSRSRSPSPARGRDKPPAGPPQRGRPTGKPGPGAYRRNSSSVSSGPRNKPKQRSRSASYDSRSPPPARNGGRRGSYSRSPSPPKRGENRRELSSVPAKRRRYSDSLSRSPPPVKRGRRES
ncbi:Pre-mRNA-splicing factor cwc22 [Ilyonectria robusta]